MSFDYRCPCGYRTDDFDDTAHRAPDDSCCNCSGRRCMACVFREVHDCCVDDCPACCAEPGGRA